MKLNWAERLAVNNPLRPIQQNLEIRWLKKWALLPPGARVLEIGCGRGAGATLIFREFTPAFIHAMDLDLAMIHRARNYFGPKENRRISFFVADVTRLPYPDSFFDAVFGFGVLHHVPDWHEGLFEIARVIKPGGLYFMEELYPSLYQNFLTKHLLLHPKENRFRSAELKESLKGMNFTLLHSREIRKFWILAIFKRIQSARG
jgi:ubiquinone/menaquinone biosynthesis C-methylase UbiE